MQKEKKLVGLERQLENKTAKFVSLMAIIFSLYHLYANGISMPEPLILRNIHFGFIFGLGFLRYRSHKGSPKNRIPIYDWILSILSICVPLYILINYEMISTRISYISPVTNIQTILGFIAIFLIIELTRRTIGWPLAFMAAISVFYALFGNLAPGVFRHAGMSVPRFIDFMYLSYSGIFGRLINISATILTIFILFGVFLEKAGFGEFLTDLTKPLGKRLRGGEAKSAIFASAAMGSISGSAIANTYATGQFTIPLMIKSGFKPYKAGAIEAVASTSGQVMPPVMSSAVFIMADITGIPYIEIALASLTPALFFLISVYIMVHIESIKLGLTSTESDVDFLKKFLSKAHLILPIILLVIMLIQRYTPVYSAFITIIFSIIVSWFRKETRIYPKDFILACKKGGLRIIPIASAIVSAAIIIGVINLTGIGLRLTSIIVSISGGFLPIGLILIMLISIVLGMGLPTPAAYLIVALFAAPMLTELGVALLAAHLFVLYFAKVSVITPPVALAAYAGAEIAEANANQVGFEAVRLGIAAYLVPFVFVYNPGILMLEGFDILSVLSAMIGVLILAISAQRWFLTKLSLIESFLGIIATMLILHPYIIIKLVGLVLTILILGRKLFNVTGGLNVFQAYEYFSKGLPENF